MKDGTKLILGIVAGIALMLIGVALLIWFDISLWMFLAMNAVGTALIILPIASIDGDWVSLRRTAYASTPRSWTSASRSDRSSERTWSPVSNPASVCTGSAS